MIPWYRYPPFGDNSIGGLSVTVWDLVQSLRTGGAQVEVLCPKDAADEENPRIDGVVVHRNNLGTMLSRNKTASNEDLKFTECFDYVFSVNNYGSNSLSRIRTKTVRQIHTIAHDRPVSSFLTLGSGVFEYAKMYLERKKEMSAEKVLFGTRSICVSNYNLKKMLDFNLEMKNNLVHIPNGVDTSLFKPAKKKFEYDLVFIGRFQRLKGLDIFISALKILSLEGSLTRAAIVGPFSEREQNFCIRGLPQTARAGIKFLGVLPHRGIPSLLNSSKVLVAPSRYESFSLPVLEAIACGTPIVASSVGGIPELVDENTGLLVKELDAQNLARFIQRALDDLQSVQERSSKFGPIKAKDYESTIIGKRTVQFLNSS